MWELVLNFCIDNKLEYWGSYKGGFGFVCNNADEWLYNLAMYIGCCVDDLISISYSDDLDQDIMLYFICNY